MRRPMFILVSILAVATAFGLMMQQESVGQASRPSTSDQNSAIVSKLEEIVAIRQRLLETEELNIQAGRAPFDSSAEIELVEARLQLARERNQRDAIIAELRQLVAAHERKQQRRQALGNDRLPEGELQKNRIGLLEAQVRLLREQK